ncbi:MAG TPA: response regulator [Deltaproteobacteria bacterium]|jgi:CheY-like chemotaxis protein|nr:response regulator [Deltaproteobacteria bacterium]
MKRSTGTGRETGAQAGALEALRGTHVLLVEDDDEMRKMLAFVLRRSGYRVTEERDAFQALEYLGNILLDGHPDRAPQLILIDQCMPGVCGLDLIQATRTAGMRIPAILITAFGDAEIHNRAHALDATPVLDKPFRMGELLAIVQRLAPATDG